MDPRIKTDCSDSDTTMKVAPLVYRVASRVVPPGEVVLDYGFGRPLSGPGIRPSRWTAWLSKEMARYTNREQSVHWKDLHTVHWKDRQGHSIPFHDLYHWVLASNVWNVQQSKNQCVETAKELSDFGNSLTVYIWDFPKRPRFIPLTLAQKVWEKYFNVVPCGEVYFARRK